MTVNDLSYLSSPVTELFASSHSETQSRLSDADVGAFHELGFCAGIRVLTDEQVEQLRLELEPLLNPASIPAASSFTNSTRTSPKIPARK